LAAAEAEAHAIPGAATTVLDAAGCCSLEPALARSAVEIAGGILSPHDESGDAYAYTNQLAQACRERAVEFRFGATLAGFETSGDEIIGARLKADSELVRADVFVLALGSYSPLAARELGLKLPVYPVKGYSVSLPVADQSAAPTVSIADVQKKISMSRLGTVLRAAGTAEIAGYDLTLTEARARNVLNSVLDLFPEAGDPAEVKYWTGLRPMTPDGPPILGGSSYRNLYLNTGHGTLGWTMAAGSGKIIADLISGGRAEISLDGMTLARYE
jgi:D-amino-acid dehydrogenase